MKKIIYLMIVLSSFAFAPMAFSGSFQNGSFETGPDPGVFTTLLSGNTSIAGWTVTKGSIDYIGSLWTASDGNRSLDLNGFYAQGGISQTFDTVIGITYDVSFDLSGNFYAGLDPKTLDVLAVGVASGSYSYLQQAGWSFTNMQWQTNHFQFTAGAASTILTFDSTTGLSDDAYGPALDNVSVSAVPEPATVLLLGIGLLGMAGLRRKSSK